MRMLEESPSANVYGRWAEGKHRAGLPALQAHTTEDDVPARTPVISLRELAERAAGDARPRPPAPPDLRRVPMSSVLCAAPARGRHHRPLPPAYPSPPHPEEPQRRGVLSACTSLLESDSLTDYILFVFRASSRRTRSEVSSGSLPPASCPHATARALPLSGHASTADHEGVYLRAAGWLWGGVNGVGGGDCYASGDSSSLRTWEAWRTLSLCNFEANTPRGTPSRWSCTGQRRGREGRGL